jgi:hypothetical protein
VSKELILSFDGLGSHLGEVRHAEQVHGSPESVRVGAEKTGKTVKRRSQFFAPFFPPKIILSFIYIEILTILIFFLGKYIPRNFPRKFCGEKNTKNLPQVVTYQLKICM